MEILNEIFEYVWTINLAEFAGLLFGLLCVYFLIKENIIKG